MPFNHHGDGQERYHIGDLLKRHLQERAGVAPRIFPDGRIGPDDDGSVTWIVGSDPERELVMIEFGKSMTWVGMSPQQAIDVAVGLIRHARAVAKTPVSVVLH